MNNKRVGKIAYSFTIHVIVTNHFVIRKQKQNTNAFLVYVTALVVFLPMMFYAINSYKEEL